MIATKIKTSAYRYNVKSLLDVQSGNSDIQSSLVVPRPCETKLFMKKEVMVPLV